MEGLKNFTFILQKSNRSKSRRMNTVTLSSSLFHSLSDHHSNERPVRKSVNSANRNLILMHFLSWLFKCLLCRWWRSLFNPSRGFPINTSSAVKISGKAPSRKNSGKKNIRDSAYFMFVYHMSRSIKGENMQQFEFPAENSCHGMESSCDFHVHWAKSISTRKNVSADLIREFEISWSCDKTSAESYTQTKEILATFQVLNFQESTFQDGKTYELREQASFMFFFL